MNELDAKLAVQNAKLAGQNAQIAGQDVQLIGKQEEINQLVGELACLLKENKYLTNRRPTFLTESFVVGFFSGLITAFCLLVCKYNVLFCNNFHIVHSILSFRFQIHHVNVHCNSNS